MKKVFLLLSLLLCIQFSFASFPPDSAAIRNQQAAVRQQIMWKSLQTMSVKEFGQRAGKKLSFREKLTLVMVKAHLRQAGDGAKGTTGSAIGGFFLGFFLLPIGVLIAYLLPKNNMLRRWSWIGFGAGLVFLFLVALAFGSIFDWN